MADTEALWHVFLRLLQLSSVSTFPSVRRTRRFVCHRRRISVFTAHADSKADGRLLPLKMLCSVECPRPVVKVAETVTQAGVFPFRDTDSFVPYNATQHEDMRGRGGSTSHSINPDILAWCFGRFTARQEATQPD